jgi:hypothetical protein
MRCIHITEKKKLNSIKKCGLIPQEPHLPSHTEIFKRRLKSKTVVYLLQYENRIRLEKFAKDFVYFRLWGTPRNLWGGTNENWNEIYDKFWKIEFKIFSILSIQIDPDKTKHMLANHEQDNTMPLMQDMDMRFGHNDEPLLITPCKIKPIQISVIGAIYPVIRNNKIENIILEDN